MEGTSDTLTSSEGGRPNFLTHGRYLRYTDFVRRWQTKLLDTWKVPQIHLLRQESEEEISDERQASQRISCDQNLLVDTVVKASASRAEDPGFDSRLCRGIFPGSSHTSDIKNGTSVATLPGAWRYRVSAGTGLPSVSILRLVEVESLICNLYISVAARTIV